MAIDTIKSTAVLDGAIATADIADDAVTADKLANSINTTIAAKATNTAVALKAPIASPSFTAKATISIASANGDILDFRSNGSDVGTIGTLGGATYFGSEDSGIMFNGVNQNPTSGGSTRVDNTNDLGAASYRYKNIYLGGGAFIGGTGTANKLDDYETGTWTPLLNSISSSAPAGSFSHVGSYIKVGRAVHLTIYIQCNSLSSVGGGILSIDGIPFNATTADGYMPSGIPIVHSWDPARSPNGGLTFYTNNRLAFLTSNHDSGWNWEHTNTLNATTVFRCTMTYTAVS